MPASILFINHPEKECGVHQFGENVYEAIRHSKLYDFQYCECSGAEDLRGFISKYQPVCIIYNYYGSTMPWLHTGITRSVKIPHIGIIHEVTQERVNQANKTLFDFHIAPDPTVLLTNPIVFKTGRLIPVYMGEHPVPAIPTIGSFGFGTKGKGFTRIIEQVQAEFDEAVIRFNIPFAKFGDASGEGAKAYAAACHALVKKPGIRLEITHAFWSQDEVLRFLAGNTVNCFFYDENKNRGISSVTDLALAVDKPIAISRSQMFRNLFDATPSVCIEDLSLREIISNGTPPLAPFKKEWTAAHLCWDYERICRSALSNFQQQSAAKSSLFSFIEKTPARRIFNKFRKIATRSINKDKLMLAAAESADRKKVYASYHIPQEGLLFEETRFNRILDNQARAQYDAVIKLLCQLCPDEMSRKIPEANIQQAFVFETVRNLSRQFTRPRMLSVGSYEDTAFLGLQKSGYSVEGIDPVLNYDLSTFLSKPGVMENKYDIIFSTSVIEHVQDDDRFVKEIASLLNPGGFAVLTCDFKQDYKPGDRIPRVDFRFYTPHDLEQRLISRMEGCSLYGAHDWECPQPDFWFEKINYTFAGFVAQRKK